MKMKRRAFSFEVKAVTETGTFEGYGSVFGVVDSYGEVVAPGAFAESLKATADAGRKLPVLWQHDMSSPIGVYDTLSEDGTGLRVTGRLAVPDVRQANEALALMKMGAVPDLSIGYYTRASSMDEKTGIRTLTQLDLVEVSVVTLGANPSAQIDAVKRRLLAGEFLTIREFEDSLREQGYSSRAAAHIAEHGYKSLLAQGSDEDQANEILSILASFKV